jgi:hypothetical protein
MLVAHHASQTAERVAYIRAVSCSPARQKQRAVLDTPFNVYARHEPALRANRRPAAVSVTPPRLAQLRVVKTADRSFDGRSGVRRTRRPAADLRHRSPVRLADALTRRASILSPLSCFAQRAVDNAARVDEGEDSVCRGLMFKLVATTSAPRRSDLASASIHCSSGAARIATLHRNDRILPMMSCATHCASSRQWGGAMNPAADGGPRTALFVQRPTFTAFHVIRAAWGNGGVSRLVERRP